MLKLHGLANKDGRLQCAEVTTLYNQRRVKDNSIWLDLVKLTELSQFAFQEIPILSIGATVFLLW